MTGRPNGKLDLGVDAVKAAGSGNMAGRMESAVNGSVVVHCDGKREGSRCYR